MITVKSIYADASETDGFRVLVEPVWPRKAPREKTVMNVWFRDLAPSPGLESLYLRNRLNWDGFLMRYHRELEGKRDFVRELIEKNHEGSLTLLHGSLRDDQNTAVALKMFLEKGEEMPVGSRIMARS